MIPRRGASVVVGDCLAEMGHIGRESVDAVVTDPPYGLSFMGKNWDHSVPGRRFWAEALRISKPGAFLLAFGGTRTYHRLACAIEDAGWEIRDCLMWLYGTGFPKSHDPSKAIDKDRGVWRGRAGAVTIASQPSKGTEYERTPKGEPVTDEAREWAGFGTALKPAWEPILLARRPLAKGVSETVADNVLVHGAGALNIDGCRIPLRDGDAVAAISSTSATLCGTRPGWDRPWKQNPEALAARQERAAAAVEKANAVGRWPANVLLDEEAAAMLDEQSGARGGGFGVRGSGPLDGRTSFALPGQGQVVGYGDAGGASRFFYVAKPSRAERDAGLDGMPPTKNHHPTVKPVALMRWLVRLVTPPGGVVLDPFTGSGTTGVAAVLEGFRFLGFEVSEQYAEIARRRIEHAAAEAA